MPADPSKSPRANTSNPANYSSPSVPISVYKQLAGELSVVKGEVTALKSENQQLRSNNQKLQQQVHQVIQATEHLKQMVNRYDFGVDSSQFPSPEPSSMAIAAPQPPHPQLAQVAPPEPQPQYAPLQQAAPQTQRPPVAQSSPQKSSRKPKPTQVKTVAPPDLSSTDEVEGGVNAWIIVFLVIAIVLTAFGAGYMVVLPLLKNNNSNSR